MPSKRKIPIGQIHNNSLFIGGGISKYVDSEFNISNNRINDFWKFDLSSRKWEKLGYAKKTFLEINSFNETITKIISFKGGNLIVNQDQVFWVDDQVTRADDQIFIADDQVICADDQVTRADDQDFWVDLIFEKPFTAQ